MLTVIYIPVALFVTQSLPMTDRASWGGIFEMHSEFSAYYVYGLYYVPVGVT
jgi:hypothetical protein